MRLFGKLVKTAINVVTLPAAVAADALDTLTGDPPNLSEGGSHTSCHLKKIKDEADD